MLVSSVNNLSVKLVFVYKDQLLRCCSKSKSSNTLVFCGLDFSHALNLNFLSQTREKRLVYRRALIRVMKQVQTLQDSFHTARTLEST